MVLSHLDTDNILPDFTKITEFAEKQIQQTSKPVAKYKRDTELKNDIVFFQIKKCCDWWIILQINHKIN